MLCQNIKKEGYFLLDHVLAKLQIDLIFSYYLLRPQNHYITIFLGIIVSVITGLVLYNHIRLASSKLKQLGRTYLTIAPQWLLIMNLKI